MQRLSEGLQVPIIITATEGSSLSQHSGYKLNRAFLYLIYSLSLPFCTNLNTQ